MSAGIYRIKCIENNKVYVGRAFDILGRWKEHLTQLKEGTHSCKPLLADYQKYGATKFEFSILEITDVQEESLNEELDILEAKNGVKQQATDSSTGYNYISRYRYEQRNVGSISMLNKNRIWICNNLNAQCFIVYSCLLAYYDYGKHLIITKTGLIEKETGLKQEKIKECFEQLEKANLICTADLLPYNTQLRIFALNKDEKINLENAKYANGVPKNIELDVEIVKQLKDSYNAKNEKDIENYENIISRFQDRFKNAISTTRKMKAENDSLKKELAHQNRMLNNSPIMLKGKSNNTSKKLFNFDEMPKNYAMRCENKGQARIFNLFVCDYYEELQENLNNPMAQNLQFSDINGPSYVCVGHGKINGWPENNQNYDNCYQYQWNYRHITEKEFEKEDNEVFTVFNFSEYDWEEYITNSYLREFQ